MRVAALAFVGVLGMAASAVSANAAPAVPDLGLSAGSSNIVEISGGCGRWAHPSHWGGCVSNGYGYGHGYGYGYGYRRWNNRYYGGGYDRPWRYHYRYGY
jgi:hypothetical protein